MLKQDHLLGQGGGVKSHPSCHFLSTKKETKLFLKITARRQCDIVCSLPLVMEDWARRKTRKSVLRKNESHKGQKPSVRVYATSDSVYLTI